jgi:hypothetical protein
MFVECSISRFVLTVKVRGFCPPGLRATLAESVARARCCGYDRGMNHQIALAVVMGSSLFAGMTGVFVAISASWRSGRGAGATLPRSPASWFVTAALFAAMTAALVYQGISRSFPPDFLGAAIFFVGVVTALWCALRRPPA